MKDPTISEIREMFKGYHIEIHIVPKFVSIEATGCEECGTSDGIYERAVSKDENGGSLDEACKKLLLKIKNPVIYITTTN